MKKNTLIECISVLSFSTYLLFPLFSFSQWVNNTSQNTPVCTQINDQKDYSIASDTKGGAYIIWTDKRNNILRDDIYAQRLNSLGYELWTTQGKGIRVTTADVANPSAAEDGNGGVIIAWDDSINGDRDIYAQKIDSLGNLLWSASGVGVVVKPSKQKDVKVVSDGAGGAIAVWEDSLGGFWDVYAQRISSSGSIMWAANGVPVCVASMNQKNPRLVQDGSGGVYITWQDKRNGVDYDIYAQHLNSSGVALWTSDGIAICTSAGKQTNPKIVSDNQGGAIITWQDKRGGISYDVYAQRVNSSGVIQWTSNGAVICNADSSQTSIDITSENINGAVITWRDKRNGLYHDVYTQKVNLNGTVAWTLNGIKLTNGLLTQTEPNICGDGTGGAIIAWQDSTVNNWDIKSQRIDQNGVALWNTGGNIVSNAANLQTVPKNISDGNGGSIYVWLDFRSGLNYDIYAQHLSSLGVDGINYNYNKESEQAYIYPNPVHDFAIVKINDYKLANNSLFGSIYDIYGREISTFDLSKAEYKIDVNDLKDGVYFIKIIDNNKYISFNKFTVAK